MKRRLSNQAAGIESVELWLMDDQEQERDAEELVPAPNEPILSGQVKEWMISFTRLMMAVVFGYEMVIVSAALEPLEMYFELSPMLQAVVIGSLPAGALIGALTGSIFIHRLDRRVSTVVVAVLLVAGSLLSACATLTVLFVIGRLLVGLGALWLTRCDSFIAYRLHGVDRLGLSEMGVATGVLLAHIVQLVVIRSVIGWRLMFGLAVIPVLICCTLVWVMPLTPPYLLLRGQDSEAPKLLRQQQGFTVMEANAKLVELRSLQQDDLNMRPWKLFRDSHPGDAQTKNTSFAVLFTVLRELTGQSSYLYFINAIFMLNGLDEHLAAVGVLCVGVTKFISTAFAQSLLIRVRSRTLLICGLVVMALGYFLIGTDFLVEKVSYLEYYEFANSTFVSHDFNTPFGWEPLVGSMMVVGGYSLSFAVTGRVVLSQLMPDNTPSSSATLLNACSAATNLIVSSSVVAFMKLATPGGLIIYFGTMSFVSAALMWLYGPDVNRDRLNLADGTTEQLVTNGFDLVCMNRRMYRTKVPDEEQDV